MCRAWIDDGAWAKWIKGRYIKKRALTQVQKRDNDSPMWRATLKAVDTVSQCATFGSKGKLTWVGRGRGPTTTNTTMTIRKRGTKECFQPVAFCFGGCNGAICPLLLGYNGEAWWT